MSSIMLSAAHCWVDDKVRSRVSTQPRSDGGGISDDQFTEQHGEFISAANGSILPHHRSPQCRDAINMRPSFFRRRLVIDTA